MITTTFGTQISDSQFVELLRSEGLLGDLSARISRRMQAVQTAEAAGLTSSPNELQAAADAFRIEAGMRSAAETRRWLEANQMSDDDFQALIKSRVAAAKLEAVVDEVEVESRFERNKSQFDRIRLSQFIVSSLGLAEELIFRVREGAADFAEIARQHSLDDLTRDNGGHLGLADRNSFEADICEQLFAAGAGDVIGPFSADGLHYVFHVLEVLPAKLDAKVRRSLRRMIVDERLQNGGITEPEALEAVGAPN